MIPRIGPGGGSFGDAVHYYAHDKQPEESGRKGMADSSERVDWVVSDNLPIDTERGSKAEQIDAMRKCGTVMQWTADHQRDIKIAAGGATTGRPLATPVYTYSLAWAPGEGPDKAEMLKAARSSLKVLGMDQHQTLIVAHNDTHMKHVHCIVNRVHPEHGRAATKSCDRLKLSTWAEEYERHRGKILVVQRAENNAQRTANRNTYNKLRGKGDPAKIVKARNLTREERSRIKAYGSKTDEVIRSERAAAQFAEQEQHRARHERREGLVERELASAYEERETALRDDLRAAEGRIGAKGWFRQAIRRVTGHHQRDLVEASMLKASLADLEARVAERRGEIHAQIAHEKQRLALRHENERARDEAFIAERARKRQEAEEGRAAKAAEKPKRRSRQDTRGANRTPGRTRDRSDERKAKRAAAKPSDALDAEAKQPNSPDAQDDAVKRQQDRIAQWKAARAKRSRQKGRGRDTGMGED